jgi:spore coat protein CotH
MVGLGGSRRWAWQVVALAAGVAGACGSKGAAGGNVVITPDGGVVIGGDGGAGDGGSAGVRPQPAFPIFDNTRMHEVALTMSPEDWQSILDDSRGDEDRHATLTLDGVVIEEVGVHPSGETSRFAGNPKMSVRIKFDAFPGYGKFAGIDEIKLKGQWDDPSMMRDGLAKFVYRAAVPTGDEAYARLTVNGDLRGLYCILEAWNKEAVIAHKFSEPVGPLYRIRGAAPPADPYAYIGMDPAGYMPLPWEPHIDHPAVGDDVMVKFMSTLANDRSQVESVVDMETLLSFLAASTLVQNVDGMVGDSGVQDHYQYYDPATGKFFTLPWDPDKTWSAHGETPDRSIYIHFSKTILTVIVRDTPELRSRYRDKLTAVAAMAPPEAVQAEADRIYQLIKDVVHEDPVKRYDNGTFDWSLGAIKDFIAKRYANVAAQVATGY